MAVATAIIVAAVIAGGAAVASSETASESAEDARHAAEQQQKKGLGAQKTSAQHEREWELEDRKYREIQQLEAEKRQIEANLAAEERQEAATLRAMLRLEEGTIEAEKRAEEATLRKEARATEFIEKQQGIITKERELLISMSEPFREAVADTIPELQGMLEELRAVETSPLYQLRLKEGTESIKSYYSSIGLGESGAEGAEIRKLSQQLTAEETDKQFGRQAETVGLLQQAGAVGMGTIPQMPSAAAQSMSAGIVPQISPSSVYAGGVPTAQAPTAQAVGTGAAPSLVQGVGSLYQAGMGTIPYYQYASGVARGNLYKDIANIGTSAMGAYQYGQGYNQQSTMNTLYQPKGKYYSSQGVPSVMY